MNKYIHYYETNKDFIFMFGIPLILISCGITFIIIDHLFNKLKFLIKKEKFPKRIKKSKSDSELYILSKKKLYKI